MYVSRVLYLILESSDNAQKKQFINAGPLGSLGPNPIADGISVSLSMCQ